MLGLLPVAKVTDRNSISRSVEFERRLAVTLLATAADVTALAVVGPLAFQCTFISPALPAAFSVVAFAMTASLAHMWLLTLQSFPRKRIMIGLPPESAGL